MKYRVLITATTKRSVGFWILFGILAILQPRLVLARDEWFRGLDLEPALSESSLVMIARVAEVTETKLTLGGKLEQSLQQFKFEPLQVLKGVFSRKVLLLSTSDLGGYQFGIGTRQIKAGQVRMLIVGRSKEGYTLERTNATLDQALPLLQNGNDPLIDGAKVLLGVVESRDRARKVTLLLDGLKSANGPAAVSLLASLQRRSLLAAQTPETATVVVRFTSDRSPSVREMAARTIGTLLKADYLNQAPLRNQVVQALANALESIDTDVAARVAAFDALRFAGATGAGETLVRNHLQLSSPRSTLVESAARWRAAGGLQLKDQREVLLLQFDDLVLDAPPEIQQAAGWGFAQLDPEGCAEKLALRIKKKAAASLPIYPEIYTLGELPASLAVPRLVDVFSLPLDQTERYAFASASVKIPDPRLVPLLADLLDPYEPQLRWQAMEALKKINTDGAAQTLQPHLVEEANLQRKLELAEFLGHHGIRDGYPFAIEHMSEPSLREEAVSALAAIHEPRTLEDLRRILQTSHDLAWNSAAVLALGRLGDKGSVPQFLEMVQDLKNPMAPAAMEALGDLMEVRILDKLEEGLGSRNPELVAASARAAGHLLALPEVKAESVHNQLAALLTDGDAELKARAQAFRALVALNDARLEGALAAAVLDGHLEGSGLMNQIEKQIRDRKVRL